MSTSLFAGIEDSLGDYTELVRNLMIEKVNMQLFMARQALRRIGEANARIERAAVDGLGQCMMSVDANLYHWWAAREPGCWQDKQFRREILRDNPEVRVKYKPRKTTLRVDGLRADNSTRGRGDHATGGRSAGTNQPRPERGSKGGIIITP